MSEPGRIYRTGIILPFIIIQFLIVAFILALVIWGAVARLGVALIPLIFACLTTVSLIYESVCFRTKGRKMPPLAFLWMNIGKTAMWTAQLIITIVSAALWSQTSRRFANRTDRSLGVVSYGIGILIFVIIFLVFAGELIYAIVVYIRWRRHGGQFRYTPDHTVSGPMHSSGEYYNHSHSSGKPAGAELGSHA